MNMDAATNVGIVYCGDNPNDVEFMKSYVQTLRNLGKQVKSLGLFTLRNFHLGLTVLWCINIMPLKN